MNDDDTEERLLIEAGRAVRPYLPGLVDDETANALDGEVARLLAEASEGGTVGPQLAEALSRHDSVRQWAAEFFAHGRPPDVAPLEERAFQELPGSPGVDPDKYVCPAGDYTYYRRAVGVAVPQCPTHEVALVPADQGA